ncbi:hypothetical protein A2300_03960 [Candidatus Falkowbacteria bacterium RIFOXYB2_FULL_35_7]|uniref:Uncharacterized protein n=1 Tax=Candidatus Falkowbacteria bacterium RIFOXYC2_FULL_36_12 TaxID=1798002 RepID=A0A1F5T0T9_9BACT|nr:MAG: hypothetical protein A2300_03960 [Candidatus Falkowbacteria bacterium RIFOXYB2_FULL_35_7]OGF32595.1 MAG: hypothetical protein A2478_00030 [Candidatus Falkowbacteria bacterium RIFOXYC2_FULL_36_12]
MVRVISDKVLKEKEAERKEMIKSGESNYDIQYDKGYLHALDDIESASAIMRLLEGGKEL